jgi:pimeloyl-ACP methyl ester carboxylesterase
MAVRPAFSIAPSIKRRGGNCGRRVPRLSCTASVPRVVVVRHETLQTRSDRARSLVYLAGLDGAPLPPAQLRALQPEFHVISVTHAVEDRSDWDTLARAVANVVVDFSRHNSDIETGDHGSKVILVGESWGAALAMRVAAECARQDGGGPIERLLLINSGTGLANDPLLRRLAELLPLLKVDRSERFLYRAAALLLYKAFLVDESRLDVECIPTTNRDVRQGTRRDALIEWLAKSVDIDAVPLDTMLFRVSLLLSFQESFSDACAQRLITVPTTIVASERDRLLRSKRESGRLSQLLPAVDRVIILPDSAHACLQETGVLLANWISEDPVEVLPRVPSAAVFDSEDKRMSFEEAFTVARNMLAPWKALTSPVFHGRHNVSLAMQRNARGTAVLFVGNHGVYGLLDMPLLIEELSTMMSKGRRLRSMAHETHFGQFSSLSGGAWGRFATAIGAVPATPRNFYRLLRNGEAVLLFPGGAAEVCRRRGQNKYSLVWKENTDFVRSAAKLNATIVPFSA